MPETKETMQSEHALTVDLEKDMKFARNDAK